ncbi:unnamed protein product [Debaryomyces tyrocola]|nr:unnamed protein product [Debaryomyces tyrocola]
MKILSDEEKNAHWNAVLYEGAKGCAVGTGVAFGLVTYMKKRHAVNYARMSASVKSALWAMPVITVGAFYADDGSVKFDEEWHRSSYLKQKEAEEMKKWNNLAWSDQLFYKVNNNKYGLIIGAWAASLYGSWKLVNRDKFMSASQKAVQARVYAQAITVVLLLGTILMSLHEQELRKKEPEAVPEWKKYLQEQSEKKKEQEAHSSSN